MKHISLEQSVVDLATAITKNNPIQFGSVCSGIEAASVAWEPMGWKAAWFAEIEAFPSAVLDHHWPEVQNLGDMTKIRDRIATGEISAPDVLVGGTPCQAFSVAGARKSLDDDRGQLTLEYVRLLNEIDAARSIRGDEPAVAVWENVPGVLNTKDNAFGCFLGALAGEECELQPTGKRWTNAGCVFGPQRAVAWRTLDAQYFGVAQRRRRVFVVTSARNGFDPAEVLFEWEGVRRDTPPSRSTGQDIAKRIGVGFASSSFGQYRPVVGNGATIKASRGDVGGGSENLVIGSTVSGKDIFPTLASSMGKKLWLGNQEAFSGDYFVCHQEYWNGKQVTGTLTKCGMNQLMPDKNNAQLVVSYAKGGDLCDTVTTKWAKGSGGPAGSETGNLVIHGTQDPIIQNNQAFPLGCNSGQENVVFSTQGNTDRHAVAYTLFEPRSADGVLRITPDQSLCPTLNTMKGGQREPCIATPGLVRRLTPIECERLQGFPDNHTQIPYRKKPAEDCPDGPRYAACGNSMAVPVMAWIGNRINNMLNQIKNAEYEKAPATENS